MRRVVTLLATALLGLCWHVNATGATDEDSSQPLPDKSGYNFLNPTPDEAMRELSPDRPDKTESPYTVDAGHFQLEMDFANYTQDDSKGVKTYAWNVAPVNVKVGSLPLSIIVVGKVQG